MSNILNEKYRDLAAQLGDAYLKRDKIELKLKEFNDSIAELKAKIMSINDNVPLINELVQEGKVQEATAWRKKTGQKPDLKLIEYKPSTPEKK